MNRKPTHDWWPPEPEPTPKSRDKNPVHARMKLAMAQTIGRVQAPLGTWDSWSPEGQANLLERAEEELIKERDKIAQDMAANNNWGDYDELPITTVLDLEHHATQEMERNFRATEKAVNDAAKAMSKGTITTPNGTARIQFWNPADHANKTIKFLKPIEPHVHWDNFPKKKPT